MSGPVPVQLAAGRSANQYTAQLTMEGTYTISVVAEGPYGQTFSDTVTIVVLLKSVMDNLLRDKWTTLIDSLARGDGNAALGVISSRAKPMYEAMFSSLGGQLPSIAATAEEFNLVSISNKRGKYELVTRENGTLYSYEVVFVKEDTGLWALHEF